MTTTLHLPIFFSADTALVEDEAHHHLFKVKRLQAGERNFSGFIKIPGFYIAKERQHGRAHWNVEAGP